MWGGFDSNTQIFWKMQAEYSQVLKYSKNASNYSHYLDYLNIWVLVSIQIMQVITHIICMFYMSNVNIVSNASNYLHYLHDLMQVSTCIICSIHNIYLIKFFEYFESNNNAMWGGFKSSISAMQVMRVFESSQGRPILARLCYASIQISQIFFWYLTMLSSQTTALNR